MYSKAITSTECNIITGIDSYSAFTFNIKAIYSEQY